MRLLAPILLVGYLALVPFCFFGGMTNMHATHTKHATLCAMSANCHEKSADTTATNHNDMYFSITNAIPTFIAEILLIAAAFLVGLLVAVLSFAGLLTISASRFVSEYKKVRLRARHRFLSWLALSETSPTFA